MRSHKKQEGKAPPLHNKKRPCGWRSTGSFCLLTRCHRDGGSHDSLSHHGLGDLQEAGDVGAEHQVAGLAALDGSVVAGLEDLLHDAVQALIHFVEAPAQTHAVLGHLEAGGGDAARVGRLAGAVEEAVLHDDLDRLGGQRHVRTFEHGHAAVVDQSLGAGGVHLVLAGAGVRDVALDVPDVLAAFDILGAGNLVSIDADAGAALLLDVEQDIEVDAVGIVDVALGVGHGNDLAAELGDLLSAVLRDVAGAGDDDRLALVQLDQ